MSSIFHFSEKNKAQKQKATLNYKIQKGDNRKRKWTKEQGILITFTGNWGSFYVEKYFKYCRHYF